ncbi:MAG: hypothetical protein K0R76_729 [Alphaproteobacteria bacterium]|jgi:hypothetical protein|nr:hypothetical protein [Alphaproteobacteria bacterium]
MKLTLKSTASVLTLIMALATPTVFAMDKEGPTNPWELKKLFKKAVNSLQPSLSSKSDRQQSQASLEDGMFQRVQKDLDNKFALIERWHDSIPVGNRRIMELLWNGGPTSEEGNRTFNIACEVVLRAHLIHSFDPDENARKEAKAWRGRGYTYLHTKFVSGKYGYYDINPDTKGMILDFLAQGLGNENYKTALSIIADDPDNQLERRLLTYTSPDPRKHPYFDEDLDPFCAQYLKVKDLRNEAERLCSWYKLGNKFSEKEIKDFAHTLWVRTTKGTSHETKHMAPTLWEFMQNNSCYGNPEQAIRNEGWQMFHFLKYGSSEVSWYALLNSLQNAYYSKQDNHAIEEARRHSYFNALNECVLETYPVGNLKVVSLFDQVMQAGMFTRQSDYANAIHHHALANNAQPVIDLCIKFKELFPPMAGHEDPKQVRARFVAAMGANFAGPIDDGVRVRFVDALQAQFEVPLGIGELPVPVQAIINEYLK